MPDHIEHLLKRLEALHTNGRPFVHPRNPDGPEAARLLREMADLLKEARDVLAEVVPDQIRHEGFDLDKDWPVAEGEVSRTFLTEIGIRAKRVRNRIDAALTKGKPHD